MPTPLRETVEMARRLQPDVMLRARGIGNYGSSNRIDYPLATARWEGMEKPAYLALIRADHAEDIAITGAGIDPDSCQHVTIDHCTFDTGDDNIAIKSGKGQEGFRVGRQPLRLRNQSGPQRTPASLESHRRARGAQSRGLCRAAAPLG